MANKDADEYRSARDSVDWIWRHRAGTLVPSSTYTLPNLVGP